jgi:hypothetical protein
MREVFGPRAAPVAIALARAGQFVGGMDVKELYRIGAEKKEA